MKVDEQLLKKYDEQYDETLEEWRMLGAKQKAGNIMEITKGLKFNNMLDIGSGNGSVLFYLDKHNFCPNITSAEISQTGIESLKARKLKSVKRIVRFDGYHLPFEDNSFDLATCSHVIEHVEFPRMLIREIVRVSKYQVFEIPIDFSLTVDKKVERFLSYGHINVYTPQIFRFLLQTEGLKIEAFQNKLYSKEVFNYTQRNKPLKAKLIDALKRYLRKHLLMSIKPDITVVLTSKTGKKLQIME